jgi:hypothetical protein
MYTHTNKRLEKVLQIENIISTKADGHCLLYAISSSYPSQLKDRITPAQLISKIVNGIQIHPERYKTQETGIFNNLMTEYLEHKRYDNDFVDIVPNIICDALNIQLDIFDSTDEANTVIKRITPYAASSLANNNKARTLTVHFANNHYQGYVCNPSTAMEPFSKQTPRDHQQSHSHSETAWKQISRRSPKVIHTSYVVPTGNRYASLKDEASLGSKDDKLRSSEGQLGSSDEPAEVLLIGDHNVSNFHSRCKIKRSNSKINIKSLCQLSLKVEHVALTYNTEISNTHADTPIILQVGAKNAQEGSEKTVDNYRKLLKHLKNRHHYVHVIGIIPQPNWGDLTVSRVLGINSRLSLICDKLDVQFSDFWDSISNPNNYTRRHNSIKRYINELGHNILSDVLLETATTALQHARNNVHELSKNEETRIQNEPGGRLSCSN